MVINQDGEIFHENMNEFNENITVYALWEDKNLKFRTEYLANRVKGVSYNQKRAIALQMVFSWHIFGELPERRYLDSAKGCNCWCMAI